MSETFQFPNCDGLERTQSLLADWPYVIELLIQVCYTADLMIIASVVHFNDRRLLKESLAGPYLQIGLPLFTGHLDFAGRVFMWRNTTLSSCCMYKNVLFHIFY